MTGKADITFKRLDAGSDLSFAFLNTEKAKAWIATMLIPGPAKRAQEDGFFPVPTKHVPAFKAIAQNDGLQVEP